MTPCQEMTKIALRVPAQLEYIAVVRAAINAASVLRRFSADDRSAIELAVGEACDNAVRHCEGEAEQFEVRFCLADEELIIEVSNEGNGFAPDGPASMPDALAEHGRGLALMENLMDEVEFLPEKDHTTVRMRKKIGTP